MDPRTKPSPFFATDEVSWIGLSAGPLAWFAAHVLNYAIVPWSCATHDKLALHLVSLVSLLIVAVGAAIAWRDWRSHNTVSAESDDPAGRAHFIGLLAFCSCLVFGLVLLMEGIGQFYFDPCQR
jgi:hypothetical protein